MQIITAAVWQITEGHIALSHEECGCFHKLSGEGPMAKHMPSKRGDIAIPVHEDNGDAQGASPPFNIGDNLFV